jgi:hypothetical protein
MEQQQPAEEIEGQLTDAEVIAECRRIMPALTKAMGEWHRLRDPKTGCPVMRHLLDE